MPQKSIILFLFIFCVSYKLLAQEEGEQATRIGSSILDDTTQVLFGPETVRFFNYDDFVLNTASWNNIDTTVFNLHRFGHTDFYEGRFQDLGVIGTAIRPIYYQFPNTIGLTSGFNVYDQYFTEIEDINFFNTQSPYSRIALVLGGQGRATTEVSYTRNIDVRSNVGFNYDGYFIDKQIERARRGDRLVEKISYNFHGNYQTKDGKYRALAAFLRNNHEVQEYGGVRDTNPQTPLELFYEDTVKVSFASLAVRDLRQQYLLYHEYELTPFIEVYHELEHSNQLVQLSGEFISPDSTFYPDQVITDSVRLSFVGENVNQWVDVNQFQVLSNRIGISGTVGLGFYKLYVQNRRMNIDFRYVTPAIIDSTGILPQQVNENLAGAMIRLGEEDGTQILGQADYLEGGFYNIYGRIAFGPFYGSIQQVKRKPSYLETGYRSTFNEWFLNPEGPVSSELDAGLIFKPGRWVLNGGTRIQRLTNHIYFEKTASSIRAAQNNGTIAALSPYIDITSWFGKHWLLDANATYSIVGGDNPQVYPLPELLANLQFSFNDISFQGNLEWQLGFDIHWTTEYFAPGYDPLVQQFYIQNEFLIPAVPRIDLFLNAKINRGRIFLKFNNLFQIINGYGRFPTPYYPGQVATLDFGFDWSFYD